jgi:hypothetical protein
MLALHIFVALVAWLCYRIEYPLDLLLTLSAFALNLLGDFLATVTGAAEVEFLYVYSRDAFMPDLYCSYVIFWIWKDGARLAVCCVLICLVTVAVILVLYDWSWRPSRRRRMEDEIERMEKIDKLKEEIKQTKEQTEMLRAQTLAEQNRWKQQYGFTDGDVARVYEVDDSDDEAFDAHVPSMRREPEWIVELRDKASRLREREARDCGSQHKSA